MYIQVDPRYFYCISMMFMTSVCEKKVTTNMTGRL